MWEAFKNWIFDIIQFFYNFCGDWGMAIIIITVLFRILVSPLVHSQSKSSYTTQKMQPKLQELQVKYADDQLRLQEETQKLYAEAKFNPISGCIPMLLQMPIFIALFQVLRNMPEYVEDTTEYVFYNLVPDLIMTPSQAWELGFGTFIPYLILMLIFAFVTFLPMVLQMMGQKNNPQMKTTLITAVVMSVMMLWISWSSPAGVLLFWGTSSIIGVCQQQISLAVFRNRDKKLAEGEALEVKPVEVNVTRKAKKPRQKKKH